MAEQHLDTDARVDNLIFLQQQMTWFQGLDEKEKRLNAPWIIRLLKQYCMNTEEYSKALRILHLES